MKTIRKYLIVCVLFSLVIAFYVYYKRHNYFAKKYDYHHRMELYYFSIYSALNSNTYVDGQKLGVATIDPRFAAYGIFVPMREPMPPLGDEERKQSLHHRKMKEKYLDAMKKPWISVD